jgi:hypothetical protein
MRASRLLHILFVLAVAGCGRSPSQPSGQPAVATLSPGDGAAIPSATQPVVLRFGNAPGATQYRIEVATDKLFATVVDQKTVPASSGPETSATLDILKDSTVYFWRVTADNGVGQGVGSVTPSFAVGPAILPGPYKLQVGVTSTSDCNADYGQTFATQWLPLEMQHDLQISQNSVTFAIDGPLPYRPPLALNLIRNDNQVSGSMVGGSPNFAPTSWGMYIVIWGAGPHAYPPAPAVGRVNYDGRMSGTVNGTLSFAVEAYDGAVGTCQSTSLPWTLTPVR